MPMFPMNRGVSDPIRFAGGGLGGMRPPVAPVGPAPFRPPVMPMPQPGPIASGPFQIGAPQQAPMGQQMPLQQQRPIASFDKLKKSHTIKKSGIYKLKKGERVMPLKSLARAQ